VHTDTDKDVAEEADGQGLLIFSTSLRVLYRDHHAWNLCNLINQLEHDKPAKGILPAKVFEACLEIAKELQSASSTIDSSQLQARAVLGNLQKQVFVLAIGLPDSCDPKESRILVILEEAGHRSRVIVRAAQRRFRFSEKETLVVQHLLKGWTNKEIANEVRVTEQTIKEHVKNVMRKTSTETRTGIIIAISGLIPESEPQDEDLKKTSSLGVCHQPPGASARPRV
jgi:DNA-binding CsgD family transcriptional regulator